jgi:hypothetical protein
MGGVGVFERVAVLSESDSFHHPATGVGTHVSSFASMVDCQGGFPRAIREAERSAGGQTGERRVRQRSRCHADRPGARCARGFAWAGRWHEGRWRQRWFEALRSMPPPAQTSCPPDPHAPSGVDRGAESTLSRSAPCGGGGVPIGYIHLAPLSFRVFLCQEIEGLPGAAIGYQEHRGLDDAGRSRRGTEARKHAGKPCTHGRRA